MSLFSKLFANSNALPEEAQWLEQKLSGGSKREIKKLLPAVRKIAALEPEYRSLSDEQLAAKTPQFKQRLSSGETLDDILPEAFATVREAADRVLGLRPFTVQLLCGIVLHQGRIAEMKTGEGKTLVAALPCYLNALEGKGVHVVTVNDYLAKVGKEEIGKIHEFLGLTVGLIVHGLTPDERRAAYAADITYGTNNEMGFDYLRDNMALYKENMVQRGHVFAIVDEVDSILIDEARTPLIISGQADEASDLYEKADAFVRRLKVKIVRETDDKQEEDENIDADYVVDEKARTAVLTERGVAKAEKHFEIENWGDLDNSTLSHHVNQAIKAHGVMKRDVDYVVQNGEEIIIVDEFTGRLMFGRRYSEGLHQAIEAKEHVAVAAENKTSATITFQNYFRMYAKLSGMTGTALTEAEEFAAIYKLDIVEIPTNRPMIRADLNDVVYKNEAGKLRAIIAQIKACYDKGQPVLVGTVSVDKSEHLSKLLTKEKIPHNVLNALHHEREAEIIAEAGRRGGVTIATNMAGRGTDIRLGGADATHEDYEAVRQAGGLFVLGTERHESRRIDNQLRGRSGRQGDPGESRFFIALTDDIMRLFGSERVMGMMETLGVDEDQPIDAKVLSGAIENAQKKVESRNFQARKTTLEYDDVMNMQRELIYKQRKTVLDGEDLEASIKAMIDDVARGDVEPNPDLLEYELEPLRDQKSREYLARYEAREAEIDGYFNAGKLNVNMREIERVILLRVVDEYWMDHIDAMQELRRGIQLRAYGNAKPIDAYKKESFEMFDAMITGIKNEVVKRLLNVHVRTNETVERKSAVKNLQAVQNVGGDSDPKNKPGKTKYAKKKFR
ncbi:MAG: preprotein translocase subunit SecA [Oscillospiraceae bacterium]|jgi:preprotein translocase subunit SecA|nr:preprotein translocase subunit SecA [Oscillospiraceae bacterium]